MNLKPTNTVSNSSSNALKPQNNKNTQQDNSCTLDHSNRRNAFWWLLILLGLSLFIAWKFSNTSPFYSDITELLPHTQQQPEVIALEKQLENQFSRQLLLLIRSTEPSNQNPANKIKYNDSSSLELARTLKQKLLQSPYLTDRFDQQKLQSSLHDIYQPYRNQLLTPQLREKLQQQSSALLAQTAAAELFNPTSTPRPYAFSEDPFNLGGQWLAAQQNNSKVALRNGWPTIYAARGNWHLINLELNKSPFQIEVQNNILSIIENFNLQVKQDGRHFELLESGLIFHAAAGAKLAKKEISSVGIGSITAIIILVLLVFRSSVPLLGVFIALSSGLICALAISLFVFDRIHLLTLAFGSTLLGVAVDYCFHFMLNSQQLGCSQRCRKLLAPALATSALSSIAAYLLQLATPFPGIQQMAVFSAAGLAGTWLAVIALGPFYQPKSSNTIHRSGLIFQRYVHPFYNRFRSHHRLYMGVICGLFLAAALTLQYQPTNNDVRTLNTSGDTLINTSKKVEQLLQPNSSSRFYVVSAASSSQLITRLETLRVALKPLRDRKFINSVQSLAQWSPSLLQQQQDYILINNKLYQQALPKLCQQLSIKDCNALKQSATSQLQPSLNPDRLESLSILDPIRIIKSGQGVHATMLLKLNPLATDSDLKSIAVAQNGVHFINRIDNLSGLLVSYRQAVSVYLATALALIAAILFYRYRLCGLRILIPMTLSALIGLAVAAQCCGITVFHLLAVLLVVGISLDTGIFYREVGFNSESWLAATLSSLTSILAFGLLSMSQVPVLHQFGIVVLAGITSSWLIAPIFFATEDGCAT